MALQMSPERGTTKRATTDETVYGLLKSDPTLKDSEKEALKNA